MKSTLAYPNGLTASWTYGNRGELLEVNNASPTGTISRYAYTYDAAGRRVGCDKSGSAFMTPDTYAYRYNARSELTNATAAIDAAYNYGYDFDDIGNRRSSVERRTQSAEYMANNLNQYTAVDAFVPQYDADGNQTLVKTATGTWQVTYNGENRPILWTCLESNNQTNQTISMSYDRMGRRVTKNNQRFVYNGYLQIANFELQTSNIKLHTFVWDPTEPVATRPLVWLVLRSLGEGGYYAHDGNKNVSEVMASDGTLAAHYEYTPFGAVIMHRGPSVASNPWLFSSEYAENETATVCYNYRHYEPVMGRWLSSDPLYEKGGKNLFSFCNNTIFGFDILGLQPAKCKCCCAENVSIEVTGRRDGYLRNSMSPDIISREMGHNIKVLISMAGVPSESNTNECKLIWREQYNADYLVAGRPVVKGEWNTLPEDSYQFSQWKARPGFDATGKLTVSIADYPRIEIEREYSDGSVMRRNVDRVLKFDISILSGEGCPCLKSKRQIKATQRLVAKDGVPVWEESYFTIEQ